MMQEGTLLAKLRRWAAADVGACRTWRVQGDGDKEIVVIAEWAGTGIHRREGRAKTLHAAVARLEGELVLINMPIPDPSNYKKNKEGKRDEEEKGQAAQPGSRE